MQYGLVLVTPQANEPVTLDEQKAWLRLEQTADDTLVGTCISAAREYCENWTGRQLVQAQWMLTQDSFYEDLRADQRPYQPFYPAPAWRILLERQMSVGLMPAGIIRLPKPPCISVDLVQYVDTSGNLQNVSPTIYMSDLTKEPAWLLPAYGQVWPTTRNQPGAVQVTFTSGYATVPEGVKQAIKILAAMNYEQRTPTGNDLARVHDMLTNAADYGEYR